MMTKPYTHAQDASGQWQVLYFGQTTGITFPLEADALSVALRLSRAVELAHGQGYDAGQNDAERLKYRI